ncbi:MAG: hypothetical protein WBV81_08445 [Ignavibacteriaceae bacterium]
MVKKNKELFSLVFILFISLFLITGCGKKEENGEVKKPSANEPAAVDTANKATEAPKDTIPDITGNWKGTFDQRSATMSVIKQTGKDFSAIMTINYRQPLTKTVNGTIDPENKTVSMEDLNASRFAGQYNGQLLDDGKLIKGNFIMKADGKSYGFNFKMK